MSFVDVVEAVHEELVETLRGEGAKLPSLGIGAREKSASDAPPRIVWIPTGGVADGPGRQSADIPTTLDGSQNAFVPRPLHRRWVSFDVHVWATAEEGAKYRDHLAAAETLAQRLIAAARRLLSASVNVTGEDWSVGGDQQNSLGAMCVLRMALALVWTRDPDAVAIVQTFPTTMEAHGP